MPEDVGRSSTIESPILKRALRLYEAALPCLRTPTAPSSLNRAETIDSHDSRSTMGEVNVHISIWPLLMMIKKDAFLIHMLPTHDWWWSFFPGIQYMCQHTAGQHVSDDDHFLEWQTVTRGSRWPICAKQTHNLFSVRNTDTESAILFAQRTHNMLCFHVFFPLKNGHWIC